MVRAAADGSGPPVGTRVVTLGGGGAWAELRAVDTDWIGTLPEGADLGEASTLPVAAGSALRGPRRLGPILGRRVLVTGAGSGVGRYTPQLVVRGGAHVIALTTDPAKEDALGALGAHEVVVADRGASGGTWLVERLSDGPVRGVIDMVGGSIRVAAYRTVAPGGTLIAMGHSSGAAETFPHGDFAGPLGHDRALTTFFLLHDHVGIGADLTWLAGLLGRGELDAGVGWRGPWTGGAEALAALATGKVPGKAVLDLPSGA
ncbi:zinc-binding dehydrogenase [Streptomyces sp. PT12]|uniref:zinc-binding dehydrogenase n=1 Tax=Streptomyces sp. PT12 TaxID=1510197 RepID=UPI0026B499E4|nr:zinc-binding dehydrogenase [Streptomyces sp. PT12]